MTPNRLRAKIIAERMVPFQTKIPLITYSQKCVEYGTVKIQINKVTRLPATPLYLNGREHMEEFRNPVSQERGGVFFLSPVQGGKPMTPDKLKRKLAAILSADVQGYSRLMEADEEGTIRTLKAYMEVINGFIEQHRGRLVATGATASWPNLPV